MPPVEAEQVRALAEAVAAYDGVAAFSEQTLLNLTSGRQVQHLPVPEAGRLVAYAQIEAGSAELAVHPEHRRRGLGSRLLDAALATDDQLKVWAHGPHPGAAPLAESRGMEVVRELWLMTTPVSADSPAPEVPDDVTVTTFVPDRDAEDWLAVNARAFAEHPEQGRMTRTDLDARTAEPWFDAEGFWLARDSTDGTLLASMWTKVSDAVGEIYVLGVDPQAQGRGLGTLLTEVAMHRFAELGLDEVELYVEGDNETAIRTYRRSGFRRRRADVQYAAR